MSFVFLPSLLEYSTRELENKLNEVKLNQKSFFEITNQKEINFHLDFVLPDFAESRGVESSLTLEETFKVLEEFFAEERLVLTIHLMGLDKDLENCFEYFKSKNFNSNWTHIVFVGEEYFDKWKTDLSCFDLPNFTLGIWKDVDEWDEKSDFSLAKNYLLMTVKAGKSGQKLTEDLIERTLEVSKKNQNIDFVVDGGWSVDFESETKLDNLQIVSYSSFWKRFLS